MSTLCHPADLAVADDVRREHDPDPQRVVLWLRGAADEGRQDWQRLSGHLLARAVWNETVHVVPVRVAGFRQDPRSDFRRVFDRFWSRQRRDAGRYVLPTGDWVEPHGQTRGDALLAWSVEPEGALDAGRAADLWPGNEACRQLGPNLLLVLGVDPPPAASRPARPSAAAAPPPAPIAIERPEAEPGPEAANGALPDAVLQRQLEERSRHVRDLSRRGLNGQALKDARELLDWAREHRGNDHPWVATCLLLIARLHQLQGKDADAEPLYRQALGITCPVLGDNHPNFSTGLNNLAVLYQARGDYADAEPLHLQALDIRRAALHEMHPLVATSLNNLALLHHARGNTTAAEPLLLRALEIFRATLGETHPDLATCLGNVAAFYRGLGDTPTAAVLADEERQVRRAAEGKEHVLVADTLNILVELSHPAAEPAVVEMGDEPDDLPAAGEETLPLDATPLPWVGTATAADAFWEAEATASTPAAPREGVPFPAPVTGTGAGFVAATDLAPLPPEEPPALAADPESLGPPATEEDVAVVEPSAPWTEDDSPAEEAAHEEPSVCPVAAPPEVALSPDEATAPESTPDTVTLAADTVEVQTEAPPDSEAVPDVSHVEAASPLDAAATPAPPPEEPPAPPAAPEPDPQPAAEAPAPEPAAPDPAPPPEEPPVHPVAVSEAGILTEEPVAPDRGTAPATVAIDPPDLETVPTPDMEPAPAVSHVEPVTPATPLGAAPPEEPLPVGLRMDGPNDPDGQPLHRKPAWMTLPVLVEAEAGTNTEPPAEPQPPPAAVDPSVEAVPGVEFPELDDLLELGLLLDDPAPPAADAEPPAGTAEAAEPAPTAELVPADVATSVPLVGPGEDTRPPEEPAPPTVLEPAAGAVTVAEPHPTAPPDAEEPPAGSRVVSEPEPEPAVPPTPEELEARAEAHRAAGDLSAAGPLYRQALDLRRAAAADPAGCAAALRGLALAAAAAGRPGESIGLLRDLLALAPPPAPDELYRDAANVDLLLSLVWQYQREVPGAVRAALDFVLRHRHAHFAGEEAEAGPGEVADALPAGSALVELVRFTPCLVGQDSDPVVQTRQDRNPILQDRYLAFVLPAGEPDGVALLDLGEAAALDRLAADFRAWVTRAEDGVRPAPVWLPADVRGTAPPAALALRQALLDPLAPALGGRTRWFVAPAGALACLPLDVLPLADGRPLLETHEVSYVDSGLDVLYFGTAPEEQPGPSVVAADPDFDLFLLGCRTAAEPAVRPAPDPDVAGRFGRLTATRRAAKHFAGLLGVEPWLAGSVRKGRLQGLHSPRVLHLATHAAFDDGPALALAGANGYGPGRRPPAGGDDGLLTAAEVAGLDLQATELVVLSSCDPGPGTAPGGEALLAVRRAFLQAGAAAVVLSLWKVADYHVKELLSDFYERLLAGAGRSEALRTARLALRERYPDRPEYWGAFVCHGDPGPLRPPPAPRNGRKAAGFFAAFRRGG